MRARAHTHTHTHSLSLSLSLPFILFRHMHTLTCARTHRHRCTYIDKQTQRQTLHTETDNDRQTDRHAYISAQACRMYIPKEINATVWYLSFVFQNHSKFHRASKLIQSKHCHVTCKHCTYSSSQKHEQNLSSAENAPNPLAMKHMKKINVFLFVYLFVCLFVCLCCLMHHAKCISGTDLLRQSDVLPH